MNDDFLYDIRLAVREEYARVLYAKLEAQRHGAHWWRNPRWKKAKLGGSVLLALAVVGACARELWRPHYAAVGDMWVLEVSPVHEGRIIHFETSGSSLPPEGLPLEQAAASVPYVLHLPSAIPEGYELMTDVVPPPTQPMWSIVVQWENAAGERLLLWAWAGQGAEISAPRGAGRSTNLEGVPAVLLYGAFPELPQVMPTPNEFGFADIVTEWNENGGIQLIWNHDGGHFELRTFGDYLREKDLIRVGESMVADGS